MKTMRNFFVLVLLLLVIFASCDSNKGGDDPAPRPTVDFSFTPTEPVAGQTVNFTSTSTNATSFQWSSSPGNFSATSASASHVFTEPGTYQVTLRATGPGGTTSVTKSIQVRPPAPTADFSFIPANPKIGETITFTSTVANVNSYSWSSNPAGFSSTLANPTHVFNQVGSYQVSLQATGPGGSVTVTKTVTVTADAPVANFEIDENPARINTIVVFTNTSQNATSYQWSSNPAGFSSTQANPNHTFTLAGTYQITLVATGPGGTNSITKELVILPNAPMANFTFGNLVDGKAIVGREVTFNNASTEAVSYQWTSDPNVFSSTETNPRHTFTTAGTYRITLVATGPGGTAEIFRMLQVVEPEPIADFSFSPANPRRGETVQFTNHSVNSTSYQWSSNPAGFTSTERNPSHVFNTAGTFTITLTATGPGGSKSISKTITIAELPPVADFSFSPENPESGQTITFTNLSQNATSYQWSSTPAGFNSTAANPTHAFVTAGTYQVKLIATGPGGSSEQTKTIVVTEPTPAPIADFSFSPTSAFIGETIQFTNKSQNATSYQWSSNPAEFSSTLENPSYAFTEPGTFAITLIATGPGGTASITKNIEIAVNLTDKRITVAATDYKRVSMRTTEPTTFLKIGSLRYSASRADNFTPVNLVAVNPRLMGKESSRFESFSHQFEDLNLSGPIRFSNDASASIPAINFTTGLSTPPIPEPAIIPGGIDLANGVVFDFGAAFAGKTYNVSVNTFSFASNDAVSTQFTTAGLSPIYSSGSLDQSSGLITRITVSTSLTENLNDWEIRTFADAVFEFRTDPPAAPTASYTFSPAAPKAGEQVTFTNTSQNATSFEWTFTPPGGSSSRSANTVITSTQANPVIIFPGEGTWAVRLVATGPGGSNTFNSSINIAAANGSAEDDNPCNLPPCHVTRTVTNASGTTVTVDYTYKMVAGKKVIDKVTTTTGGPVSVIVTVTYEYSASAVLTRTTQTQTVFGNTTAQGSTEYVYDGQGRRIRENSLDAAGALTNYTTYEFDGNSNRMIRSNEFNAAGQLQSYSIYDQFDSEGNYTRVRNFDGAGTQESTSTFTWENCQPKTILTQDMSGNTLLNQTNSFNSNRFISQSVSTTSGVTATTSYTYQCD